MSNPPLPLAETRDRALRNSASVRAGAPPALAPLAPDHADSDLVLLGFRMRRLLGFAVLAKLVAVLLWCFTTQRALALATFFAPDPLLFYALVFPTAQGVCRTFTHFETDRNSLWLTIDDGPDEHDTPRILDLLDRHQARATFFVIGERAARLPHLVQEIIRRGHDIAHHTHSHPSVSFWCAGPSRLGRELDATLRSLESVGVRPKWFRPPVGIRNFLLEPALNRRGLQSVGWTIRSGDCQAQTPEQLVSTVISKVTPGAIVLLHEGVSVPGAVRVRGIELLLQALTDRNFSCEIPAPHQLRR